MECNNPENSLEITVDNCLSRRSQQEYLSKRVNTIPGYIAGKYQVGMGKCYYFSESGAGILCSAQCLHFKKDLGNYKEFKDQLEIWKRHINRHEKLYLFSLPKRRLRRDLIIAQAPTWKSDL